MKKNNSKVKIIYIFLGAASLCWCIYRDIKIEKQYTGDLRNRIVGSRLQMDGVSPYFYHWKQSDGMRYYDPENHDTTVKASDVTASPFFHQLLYPIANIQQRVISKLWLLLEYMALLTMTIPALKFAKKNTQKRAILFTSLLFLYSYGWTTNIELGQIYIFIPFLAMVFYFFITRKGLMNAAFAGICAVSLILMRPNTALFFFPFIFLAKDYSRKYKAVFICSSFVILLCAFGTRQSRLYWSDYRNAMQEHIKGHQGLDITLQHNAPLIHYAEWEGWDTLQIRSEAAKFRYSHSGENGNVFVFLNLGLHTKISVWALAALGIGFITLIFFAFFKKYSGTHEFNAYSVALVGFCMYMASDVFSPVHRALYNAGQWIFPLLLLASGYSSSFKKTFVITIITGLLLNSLTVRLVPMQNTLGEYLIYAAILGLLFTRKVQYRK